MRFLMLTLYASATLVAQQPFVEIFYTGRLMGHARIPDKQSTSSRSCNPLSGQKCETGSEEAETLLKLLDDNGFRRAPNQLLLGLGDNFGPNYHARTIVQQAASTATTT